MSIFKRGKHAKDGVSAAFVQQIAEAVEPYLVDQDKEPGSRYGNGTLPGSSYGSVSLSPKSIAEIAEGVSRVGSLASEIPLASEDEGLEEVIVSPFELELDRVLVDVKALLLEKNASYGDSALNPVRIMSDADAAEQIRIRMDDKLSRLYRGFAFEDSETGNPEDTLKDLVGYYFLLKIAEARNAQS